MQNQLDTVFPWHQTYHKLSNLMKSGKPYVCDLIGDIHGHADKLIELLTKLGYQEYNNNVFSYWGHPEENRYAIFVGDLIDRGPKIRETLKIVKDMVDAGTAICLMGNHEYNAIAFWHQPVIRGHTLKNIDQHAATIHQFKNHEDEWNMYLKWFKTLPIFLDLPHLRVVHALWDSGVYNLQRDQEKIPGKTRQVKTITNEGSIEPHYWFNLPSYTKIIIENILKGEDIKLPEGFFLTDKDGNTRDRSRVKWWKNPIGLTYDQYIEDIEHSAVPGLEQIMLPDEIIAIKAESGYNNDDKPIFFGHYWLRMQKEGKDSSPKFQSNNVCCLDYSVAKKGHLVAYCLNSKNNKKLQSDNFVYVSNVE